MEHPQAVAPQLGTVPSFTFPKSATDLHPAYLIAPQLTPSPSRLSRISSRLSRGSRNLTDKVQNFKAKNPVITYVIIAILVAVLAPALLPIILSPIGL